MFWNEKAECMSKEEKEELQLKRLQETVKLAYENVEFYKKRFDEIGLKPEDIKTLKDIEKIPFTTKTDLRQGPRGSIQHFIGKAQKWDCKGNDPQDQQGPP